MENVVKLNVFIITEKDLTQDDFMEEIFKSIEKFDDTAEMVIGSVIHNRYSSGLDAAINLLISYLKGKEALTADDTKRYISQLQSMKQ